MFESFGHDLNREKRMKLWECISLITLLDELERLGKKFLSKRALGLLIARFKELDLETIIANGVPLKNLSVKEKKECLSILKAEFDPN